MPPAAGECFLRDMLMRARRARFASLWVTAADSAQLPEMLQHPPAHTLTTRATIYGTGFDDAPCWQLVVFRDLMAGRLNLVSAQC
jgi:hypothetical protein